MTDEELADQHQPYEGMGGIVECSCDWPTKADFLAVGRDPYRLRFSEHLLKVRRDTP